MTIFFLFFSSIVLHSLFLWLSSPLRMFFSLCLQECNIRIISPIKDVPESLVINSVIIKRVVLRAKSLLACFLWKQICSDPTGEILAQRHNPLNRQDIGVSIRTGGLHQSLIP